MSKPLDQIEKELDAKIPRSAVRERDGGGGRRLSYLEGHYVIDRLNQIFGPLGWSKYITEVKEVVNKTSKGEFPAYLVKVVLNVHTSHPSGYLSATKEAYGYGADKSGQNAHELAIKEAVTDALKVAAKDLGMSLGLALYDKNQENVDDGETNTAGDLPQDSSPRKEVVEEAAGASATNPSSAEKLRLAIRSHVKVAIKKGTLTAERIKSHIKNNYASETLDGVGAPEDLEAILEYVMGKTT